MVVLVTGIPLVWDATVTLTASRQNAMNERMRTDRQERDPREGFRCC
ncbi:MULTISPECIES: hypothetical protein [Streptomyces]|uniref:Uncharacterized protein n=1 Tax=Streptomyces griseosporeus TaxID=1910 RepID=A0ABV3KLF5_STRGS|nr:hypothetical protein [Streptomyces actuosus]MBM4822020.1 hypothetical protein [Streptomyces actuosus]